MRRRVILEPDQSSSSFGCIEPDAIVIITDHGNLRTSHLPSHRCSTLRTSNPEPTCVIFHMSDFARMQASTVLLLLAFTFACAFSDIQHAHTVNFRDDFSGFDKDVWRCEYDCPVIQDGKAHFHLRPGIPPNSHGSWSKSYYTPHRFTSGRFTARISQSERSKVKVWWGVALWDNGLEKDGSKYNEINFGCTTDEDNKNSELSFESTKHGKHESVKVDVGVDLYDGHFHDVALDYNHAKVQLWFDGKMIKEITNKDVIPTDPMDLVLGTRLVHGGSPLEKQFTEVVDWIEIAA